ASGLGKLLESQKDNIASALPPGLSKYLAGTGVLDSVPGNTTSSYSTQRPSARSQASPSIWSWALPALAVLALLGIAWNLFPGRTPEKTAVTTPTDNSRPSVDTTSNSSTSSSTGTSTGASGADISPAAFQALENLRGIKAGDVDLGT